MAQKRELQVRGKERQRQSSTQSDQDIGPAYTIHGLNV